MHAFHLCDRYVELTTHAGKAAAPAQRVTRGAGGARRQRDAAANRETLHQHTPALANHIRATDNGVQRYEHVFTLNRAVHKRAANRVVATANVHTLSIAGDQRQGNAPIFFVAQQVFRVEEAECQANHGGNGRQGDPALLKVQAHAHDFFAINDLRTHHAGIWKGSRI